MNIGTQSVNSSRVYSLTVAGPLGANGKPASLLGVFTGAESFSVTFWVGDDQVPVWTSTAAVTWDTTVVGNPATLPAPILLLACPKAAVATIAPGRYYVQILIAPGTLDIEVLPAGATIILTPAPGTAPAQPTYCSFDDCVHLAPWIEQVMAKNTHLPSDLSDQRNHARIDLENVIMAHYRPFSRRGMRGGVSLGEPGTGSWGSTFAGSSIWLRDQLAANLLITAGPRGHVVRDITAHWALASALDPLIGKNPGGTPYQEIARTFRANGNRQVKSYTAEFDLNADGLPDLWIPCNLISAR